MNRRGFLRGVLGAVTAVFVGKLIKSKTTEPNTEWDAIEPLTCGFESDTPDAFASWTEKPKWADVPIYDRGYVLYGNGYRNWWGPPPADDDWDNEDGELPDWLNLDKIKPPKWTQEDFDKYFAQLEDTGNQCLEYFRDRYKAEERL